MTNNALCYRNSAGAGTLECLTNNPFVVGGAIGLGTAAPQSLLQAFGGEVQAGSSGASCTGNTSGAIRYAGGALSYCNGSNCTSTASIGASTISAGWRVHARCVDGKVDQTHSARNCVYRRELDLETLSFQRQGHSSPYRIIVRCGFAFVYPDK